MLFWKHPQVAGAGKLPAMVPLESNKESGCYCPHNPLTHQACRVPLVFRLDTVIILYEGQEREDRVGFDFVDLAVQWIHSVAPRPNPHINAAYPRRYAPDCGVRVQKPRRLIEEREEICLAGAGRWARGLGMASLGTM